MFPSGEWTLETVTLPWGVSRLCDTCLLRAWSWRDVVACQQGKEWLIPIPILHLGMCFIQRPSLCKTRSWGVLWFPPQPAPLPLTPSGPYTLEPADFSASFWITSLTLPQQFLGLHLMSSSVYMAACRVPSPQLPPV